MTHEQYLRFSRLRKIVAREIKHQLAEHSEQVAGGLVAAIRLVSRHRQEEDDCHKSYDGTWELRVAYPNYFEDETANAEPDYYSIQLHCYAIGPSRHYEWTGRTFEEALRKCEFDVFQLCNIDINTTEVVP